MQLPDLAGYRLCLVSLHDAGLADMFEYSRDPQFYTFLEYPPHRTVQETADYLNRLRDRSAGDDAYYWFVQLEAERKIIGTIGLHHIDRRKGHAEIGYGIGPRFWGQGYFAEALGVLLSYAFNDLQLYRLVATTPRENTASMRALLRAGFSQEGVLRAYYLSHAGHRYDAAVMSLLKPEYQAGRDGSGRLSAGGEIRR